MKKKEIEALFYSAFLNWRRRYPREPRPDETVMQIIMARVGEMSQTKMDGKEFKHQCVEQMRKVCDVAQFGSLLTPDGRYIYHGDWAKTPEGGYKPKVDLGIPVVQTALSGHDVSFSQACMLNAMAAKLKAEGNQNAPMLTFFGHLIEMSALEALDPSKDWRTARVCHLLEKHVPKEMLSHYGYEVQE